MFVHWTKESNRLEGRVGNDLVIRLTRVTGPSVPAGRLYYIGTAQMPDLGDSGALHIRVLCHTREEAMSAASAQVNDWATKLTAAFGRVTDATRQNVDAASDMLLERLTVEKRIDRGRIGSIKPPDRIIEIHAGGTDMAIKAPNAGRAYLELKDWADGICAGNRNARTQKQA